ncbi:MAG: response regulator transcription factor [Chloroflexota bacterium]|nr:response regulator transcription factor [Chloroflexota bacterium]
MDDHPVLRDGLSALLAGERDLDVVTTGQTVEDARAILARGDVDVVLLDVRLGTVRGLAALDPKEEPRRPAVVVLTAYAYPQYARAALQLGASGFVLKDAPVEELIEALRRTAAGGTSFALEASSGLPLSARELDVVALVADGRSNDEIAARLGIAPSTVETHLRRMYERLGVASRTELDTRAVREGWLEAAPVPARRG